MKFPVITASILLLLLEASGAQQQQRIRGRRRQQERATPIRETFTDLTGSFSATDEEITKLDSLYGEQVLQSSTSSCFTYSMSHFDKIYNTPEINETIQYFGGGNAGHWGRHALQWKGYLWEEASPANYYDAKLASDLEFSPNSFYPGVPFWIGKNRTV